MSKRNLKPGAMIYPLPVAIISCGRSADEYNLFTTSWMGTLSSDPPTCYISVKPNRHSHQIIKESMEFVINLTTVELLNELDFCGMNSGSSTNKFEDTCLTYEFGKVVCAPTIVESPVNIECAVKSIMNFGSHDMFIAEIVNVKIREDLIDANSSRVMLDKLQLLAFSYGNYHALGEVVGKYGMSSRNRTIVNNY